ncbi:MAG: DUF3562 domain-containing protein [Proteobacteria bacterium]|nr:DUF3562 domain-containing protein [Desulfocapsa sp.]MBU3945412.1 DUF3562 domain-containing protein [Pseudomonadota bacterium]MCG2742884.1 DUF3562 domain-containing protein [Desulfobacteraceae bacterium]MBU3983749.1 DUF3562 domain-containing protein [Pseudomonadota bacterium]MBU4043588.1 DUF3562 domain-containing protein [Pseudomonadota bacterium]
MVSGNIPLYANLSEKRIHDSAIRDLCAEFSKPEEFIRPLYEKSLIEMKKKARIKDFLPILACRRVRDLVTPIFACKQKMDMKMFHHPDTSQ